MKQCRKAALPLTNRTRNKNAPVAVFDSGAGGIGVLQALQKRLPHEDFLYFGDSLMAPYGERDAHEVRHLVLKHAAMLLAHCKALVLACNTATAVAVRDLRDIWQDVPIIGMEPALRPALAVGNHPRVLVLATAATLKEQKFARLLATLATKADFYPLAAPDIVRLVEAGLADSVQMDAYLGTLLAPFTRAFLPDAVVLGCTHFPFAKNAILRTFGRDIPLFDGAYGTAEETARRLKETKLLQTRRQNGTVTLTTSGDKHTLALYQKLLTTT